MNGPKTKIAAVAGLIVLLVLVALNCAGSSGDDDDDDGAPQGTALAGSIAYEGDAVGQIVVIGAFEQWPPTKPPMWFGEATVPDGGFPFTYTVDTSVTGAYFLAAYLDVDPDDGVAMNLELDPMHIPVEKTEIAPGEETVVDFVLLDDAWETDDDDDDDDNDDDSTGKTGVAGTLSYSGGATGQEVVFGFWTGAAMGPPDHSASVNVPQGGFPFAYEIETAFFGDWHIVAFLDVDPNDGDSLNFDKDPNNWKLSLPTTKIVEDAMAALDITLIDP